MAADADPPERLSLKRWSQRKLEASRATAPPAVAPAAATATAPSGAPAVPELPPVESLTPDSDFAAFLQPRVDELVKRKALRKLFSDPRFNVMDGLDVYVDDYTKTVPVPGSLLARLAPLHGVLDTPPTPVAESGATVASAPAAPAGASDPAPPTDMPAAEAKPAPAAAEGDRRE
jgi:hypothetical protein